MPPVSAAVLQTSFRLNAIPCTKPRTARPSQTLGLNYQEMGHLSALSLNCLPRLWRRLPDDRSLLRINPCRRIKAVGRKLMLRRYVYFAKQLYSAAPVVATVNDLYTWLNLKNTPEQERVYNHWESCHCKQERGRNKFLSWRNTKFQLTSQHMCWLRQKSWGSKQVITVVRL